MTSACNPLLVRTGVLLDEAKSSGHAVDAVTADEVFELITSLSWGVDRFRDDEQTARRRVEIATAGIFAWSDPPRRQGHDEPPGPSCDYIRSMRVGRGSPVRDVMRSDAEAGTG